MILRFTETHIVGHIISHSFAEHWSGQFGIDIFCVQIFILAVEHQCSCVAAQQEGEGFPHHGETEHRAILQEGREEPKQHSKNGKRNIFA